MYADGGSPFETATLQESEAQEETDMSMQPNRRRNPRLARPPSPVGSAWRPTGPAGASAAPWRRFVAGRAAETLIFAVLIATGFGAAAPPAGAQTVELTWKLVAGTDLVYRMGVQSESELPGGMGTATMNLDTTQRWSVLEVDGDGNATVRLTTERVRMDIGGPMGTMSVDSEDETASGSPLDAVTTMAGTSYSVVLDPRGVLVEMSGVEELQEALRAHVPDPSAQAMVDQILSEDALRSQWGQGMLALPAEAVGVGSTWENTFTVAAPPMGSMTVATSLEVESVEGDLVVVSSSGTMSLSEGAAASSPIPVRFGDATMVGTGRFDNGRGLLLDTEGTMAFQMIMAMGGQETTMNTVSTVTMELVEE